MKTATAIRRAFNLANSSTGDMDAQIFGWFKRLFAIAGAELPPSVISANAAEVIPVLLDQMEAVANGDADASDLPAPLGTPSQSFGGDMSNRARKGAGVIDLSNFAARRNQSRVETGALALGASKERLAKNRGTRGNERQRF